MSKWSEIRIDFFDEEEKKWFVDAWETDDDNEEGSVIAKIDLYTGTVEYLDADAKTDEYAQEEIREFLRKKENMFELQSKTFFESENTLEYVVVIMNRNNHAAKFEVIAKKDNDKWTFNYENNACLNQDERTDFENWFIGEA